MSFSLNYHHKVKVCVSIIKILEDFLVVMVKILGFHCRGHGLNPSHGAKIPMLHGVAKNKYT